MPARLDFETYGEGIGNATAVIRNNAALAGLRAPVPTCPGWTVTDLLAHQGMVHRWAASTLRGERPPADFDRQTEAEGRRAADLLDWLDAGMIDLLNALSRAPRQSGLTFFLPDADDPALGWARRQCHETTVHAIDAMGARLGRMPRSEELWIPADLAADGIDELLLGFLPRPKTKLRYPREVRITVSPSECADGWTIKTGPDHASATRGAVTDADLALRGTARQLYAALWNRGDEITAVGDLDLLAAYRKLMRVNW